MQEGFLDPNKLFDAAMRDPDGAVGVAERPAARGQEIPADIARARADLGAKTRTIEGVFQQDRSLSDNFRRRGTTEESESCLRVVIRTRAGAFVPGKRALSTLGLDEAYDGCLDASNGSFAAMIVKGKLAVTSPLVRSLFSFLNSGEREILMNSVIGLAVTQIEEPWRNQWSEDRNVVRDYIQHLPAFGSDMSPGQREPIVTPIPLGGSSIEAVQELARTNPERVAEIIEIWLREDKRGQHPADAVGRRVFELGPMGEADIRRNAGEVVEEAAVGVQSAEAQRVRRSVWILNRPWKTFVTAMLAGIAVRRAAEIPLLAAGFGTLGTAVLAGATTGMIIRGAKEVGRQYAEKQRAAGEDTKAWKAVFKKEYRGRLIPTEKWNFTKELIKGVALGSTGGFVGYELADWFPKIIEFIQNLPRPEFPAEAPAVAPPAQPEAQLAPLEPPPRPEVPAPRVEPPTQALPPAVPGAPPPVAQPEVVPPDVGGPAWFRDINNTEGEFARAIQAEVGKYYQEALDKAMPQLLEKYPNMDQLTQDAVRRDMLGIMEVKGNQIFEAHVAEWASNNYTIQQIIGTENVDGLADRYFRDEWLNKNGLRDLVEGGQNFISVHDQISREIATAFRNKPSDFVRIPAGSGISRDWLENLSVQQMGNLLLLNWDNAARAFVDTHRDVPLPVQFSEINYIVKLAEGGDINALNRLRGMFSGIFRQDVQYFWGLSSEVLQKIKNLYLRL